MSLNENLLLLVATRNPDKTREIRDMLGSEWSIEDLTEMDNLPVVEETGSTFEENATLKAVQISECVEGVVLSDDSGLEVDALGGAPGIYSSRYAGEEGKHIANNAKLLNELKKRQALELEDRAARFRCCMVVARRGKKLASFEGYIDGHIALERQGQGGFGYDPLFIPEGYTQSFGELSSEIKNGLSHRARALEKAIYFLRNEFEKARKLPSM